MAKFKLKVNGEALEVKVIKAAQFSVRTSRIDFGPWQSVAKSGLVERLYGKK